MERVLLLDTECTGVDDLAKTIEVAVSLYSVRHAAVIRSYSTLIVEGENPAEHVNHIPAALLADGIPAQLAWAGVAKFAASADAVLAHNAEFDRKHVPSQAVGDKPWICTCYDLTWPKATRIGENLTSLALAHGVGVASAHRAAADVDVLARLLTRVAEMGVDLAGFFRRGLRPKGTFYALVSYDDRQMAKDAGFRWNEPDHPKSWSRRMALEDVDALPFKVRRVA